MAVLTERVPCLQSNKDKYNKAMKVKTFGHVSYLLRKFLFSILSIGPVPLHVAFIMDGNRRYAKKHALHQEGPDPGSGHQIGFKSLTSTLQYCYELGVKYVTVYAFSIDNFKRGPEEVQVLMDLMKEKIEEMLTEESLFKKFEVRVNFWGHLEMLSEPVRVAAKRLMDMTAENNGPTLSVCVAYTSTNEITHAIEGSVRERREKGQIEVSDLERNLYTAGFVEPDIMIRTSGETRLSNFLLWQSEFTHLQNPDPLWPEFSLGHLVWSLLEYQLVHGYLKKKKGETEKSK